MSAAFVSLVLETGCGAVARSTLAGRHRRLNERRAPSAWDRWGDPEGCLSFLSARVEVKVVAAKADRRFVLTANEPHKARHFPDSTVIRFVVVPPASKGGEIDFAAVRWLAGVADPVKALALERQFGLAVWCGQAFFGLEF